MQENQENPVVEQEDVAIEELGETSAAGTAFCVGSAGCPSCIGSASSFG